MSCLVFFCTIPIRFLITLACCGIWLAFAAVLALGLYSLVKHEPWVFVALYYFNGIKWFERALKLSWDKRKKIGCNFLKILELLMYTILARDKLNRKH